MDAANGHWSARPDSEAYVPDFGVRLALYRRAAGLGLTRQKLRTLRPELIDRFGSIPSEVDNLLAIVRIKQLCRTANVAKDAGPKGGVITFRNNQVINLEGLVAFITTQAGTARLRPTISWCSCGPGTSQQIAYPVFNI